MQSIRVLGGAGAGGGAPVQVAVVKGCNDLLQPGEGGAVQRRGHWVRDELGEVVQVLAQQCGQRQVHRQVPPGLLQSTEAGCAGVRVAAG